MSRWRWVTGVGVVAALAGVLIVLSSQRNDDSVVTTTSTSLIASTTEAVETTITTASAITTTTTEEQRRAEVEVLLKDLWFGWFDAIYRKDADALWEVVATTASYDAAVAAMDAMEFTDEPTREGILVLSIDILLDRDDCLVVFHEIDVSSFRGPGATSERVSVMWPDARYGFRFATGWQFANDLWQQDCDNLDREVTP